jgi:transcriptional regulator with XRE-family HTH domain
MGTRETRVQRGRRQGDALVPTVVSELRTARQVGGISQRSLATELGWSQSEVNRLEQFHFPTVSLIRMAEIASVLGLELSIGIHPLGEAIRDKGQQPLIGRFLDIVHDVYRRTREVPLPNAGDLGSWEVLLRLDDFLVGVEAEARLRDVQRFVRRIRQRELYGGVDEILVVLSRTSHNGRLADHLRDALGERFSVPPRELIDALRAGRRIPGSGVILV